MLVDIVERMWVRSGWFRTAAYVRNTGAMFQFRNGACAMCPVTNYKYTLTLEYIAITLLPVFDTCIPHPVRPLIKSLAIPFACLFVFVCDKYDCARLLSERTLISFYSIFPPATWHSFEPLSLIFVPDTCKGQVAYVEATGQIARMHAKLGTYVAI